jgi:predicted PurR-regulated permease PerM
MPPHEGARSTSLGAFTARLLIVLLAAGLAALVWQLTDVLVLLFGAILASIGLCAAARWLSRRSGIGRGAALAGVSVIGLAVFGGALWIFGAAVAAQVDDVIKVVPGGVRLFMNWLEQYPYGRQLLSQLRGPSDGTAGGAWSGTDVLGAAGWATSAVSGAVGVVTKTLAYAVIALFVALYLAVQPARYRGLCLRLVPPSHRVVAEQLFEVTADVLQRWLVGQMVVMATIGILTGLGLWALGIEAAAALGLMGGLLCFIPFVGAILAAVPATLVALTQGPTYTACVVLMYAGVHFIEGNFITPIVQAEATSLPPVLAILSTVAFSLLLGPAGVLLAAPLTLVLMAAVELLYVQRALGEPPLESGCPVPAQNPDRSIGQTR